MINGNRLPNDFGRLPNLAIGGTGRRRRRPQGLPLGPVMTSSSMGNRCWARWWLIGLAAAASIVGAEDLRADPPSKTAVADCFQRGYQPPPCTASSSTSIAPAVPDSGVTACQNQSAMATAIGLLPAVCPPTTRS